MSKNGSNLYAFLFGVFLCLVLLAGLEIMLRFFWKEPAPTKTTYAADYFYKDAYEITKASPGKNYRSVSVDQKTGKTVYDVVYTIDGLSRRAGVGKRCGREKSRKSPIFP